MISVKSERVMCMQHCSPNQNIFFIDFPSHCPICARELKSCPLHIPPFCVPCPFSSNKDPSLRCSVIIKPTKGDFLRDYDNGDNLHIGITDSKGFVYNYDERGLSVDEHKWDQCARLDLSCYDTTLWDYVLESSKKSNCWTSARYNQDSYNCYNYVLKMLSEINEFEGNQGSHKLYHKEEFCRHYILQVTIKIAKYIDLFRNIRSKETVVQQITNR